jgi:Protein of unknown function (DUF935)
MALAMSFPHPALFLMTDICNEAISKIVLSQTMTTDNGSSQSQANVHQNVKDDIVKADADLVCSSFNEGPVKWLIDWNFPGAAYPRVWRQMDAAVDLTAEADRDMKLQGLGISLKPESIAAKYGDDYLVADNKLQIPQLSGEQTSALISIVSQAKQGGWSPELVAGMINGAFPNWPDEAVAAITKNLGEGKTAEPLKPSKPVDLNAVSAQFAKKKCSKGISCGDTCIASGKICTKHLTSERRQQVKDLKKRAKGGDAIAQDALDQLRSRKSREVSLNEFEAAKFNQRFESALGITRNGDSVFEKKGSKNNVSFTGEEVEAIRGGTISHNHPDNLMYLEDDPRRDGNTFSPADIKFASLADLVEIRAVSSKYLYSISRPATGWPPKDLIDRAIEAIRSTNSVRHDIEFSKMYDSPTKQQKLDYQKTVQTIQWHEVMDEYAKSIGAKYNRVEHGHG